MSQLLNLRLESVWAVVQLLTQQNFTLIVQCVGLTMEASIKEWPVNRHPVALVKTVCAGSCYQASQSSGIFCSTESKVSLWGRKAGKTQDKDVCLGSLGTSDEKHRLFHLLPQRLMSETILDFQ